MATINDYSVSSLSTNAVPDEGYVLNGNFLSRENQIAIENRILQYILTQRPGITGAENRTVFKMFIKTCVSLGTSHETNFKNYAAQIGTSTFNYAEIAELIRNHPGRYEEVSLRKFMRHYAPYTYHAIKNRTFPFDQPTFFTFEHHFNTPRGFEALAFDFNFGIRPHQCNDRELLVLRATFQVKDNIDKEKALITSTSTYFHKGIVKKVWNKMF